jgi:hypothetical protein
MGPIAPAFVVFDIRTTDLARDLEQVNLVLLFAMILPIDRVGRSRSPLKFRAADAALATFGF